MVGSAPPTSRDVASSRLVRVPESPRGPQMRPPRVPIPPFRGVGAARRRPARDSCAYRCSADVAGADTFEERRIGHALRGRFVRGAGYGSRSEPLTGADRCAARSASIPAGSDDLTADAGSTTPYGEARGITGRYEGEVIRLDAPRFPRRSRIVFAARTGRGPRGCIKRRTSRSGWVQFSSRLDGHPRTRANRRPQRVSSGGYSPPVQA